MCICGIANSHPRILQKHLRRCLRSTCHRRIVARQILRDRAIDEQRELRRKRFKVSDVELLQTR